jgi:hypothetical protein
MLLSSIRARLRDESRRLTLVVIDEPSGRRMTEPAMAVTRSRKLTAT